VLADSAEEIRKIVKGKSGMRAVPKITFVKGEWAADSRVE
jgi:hypothetical protein